VSEDRLAFTLTYANLDRSYEDGAAEYQALLEQQARLWMLDRWRAFQAINAARSGEPRPDRRLNRGARGPGLAPVRDDLIGQGPPRHGVVHDNGGPLGSHEHAHGELDAPAGSGAVLDRMEVHVAGRPAPGGLDVGEVANAGGVVVLGRPAVDDDLGVRMLVRDGLQPRDDAVGHALRTAEEAGASGGIAVLGHASDSEPVPPATQARTDAEKAPAGSLPAVASFW
jgi:hypothetical protein